MAKRKMPRREESVYSPIPEEPQEIFNKKQLVVVNCKRLNVRANPSKTSEILFDIPEGTVAQFNPEFSDKEWAQIVIFEDEEPREGYVMKVYTQEIKADG